MDRAARFMGNYMGILALDLSKRSTGWACWMPGDENPHYGRWVLGSEFTGDGQTYCKLHECLMHLRMISRFEQIYFEQPLQQQALTGHTNIDTLRVLTGLAAHTESYAYAMGLRTVMAVHQASWRKHFIGRMPRGTKTKTWKDYSRERCAQYGWATRTDDEADALGILDYACDLKGIIPPWRTNEVFRAELGGRK
jgi:hypothetical protein